VNKISTQKERKGKEKRKKGKKKNQRNLQGEMVD
jgi:hypothetical protein